jgi:hypothetical protein
MAAAAALQCASALLSWYFAACGAMAAADALFVAGHIMAALGIGGALHISWDLMLAAAGAMPGAGARCRRDHQRPLGSRESAGADSAARQISPLRLPAKVPPAACSSPLTPPRAPAFPRAAAPLSAVNYAWDWGSVVAGVLLVRQLGGLPWRHVRLKIVGAVLAMSAVLLALLR